MEFPIDRCQVTVLVKEELDLPKARSIDMEGIGLGPILTVVERHVQPGPSRSVNLGRLIDPGGGIVGEFNANLIDPRRIVYCRGLVARDSDQYGAELRNI